VKKKIFIILIFCFFSNNLFAQSKIVISLIINNQPITNIDILYEANYLTALNPSIQNLNKKEILSIAKESLIKEKIKEEELKKHFNLNEKNIHVENILKTIYLNLNFNNKEQLESYLSQFNISLKDLIYKINIEARWNELIFKNYSNKFEIDYKKIKENLKNQENKMTDSYLVSEILFNVENKSDLKNIYDKIKTNIKNNGFESAARIYSLSNSASSGGKIGWVNINNFSSTIAKEIKNLKIKQISKPISIPGGYLILKIDDKKKEKTKLKNLDKELNKLVNEEKNRKLNQYSIIHYSKIKKNSEIIYEP
tara:strand:- start:192 stop:1121 length:930 start_codon:yes stop_codon:yes gene_type:complete